jgi:cobalamin synthase
MENNSSSAIFVTHVPKPTIKRFEEKPRYTAITFISDVGGILGVFLGISFWSVYQIIIFPVVVKLQRVLMTNEKLLF